MTAHDDHRRRALAWIAGCTDAEKLGRLAENAQVRGETDVARAARLRLYEVSPAHQPGTIEHAVWRSIYALEGTLADERGRTVRLSRTRQKIARDGELGTVRDLINGKAADGFAMLIERDMPQLTFEAVALDFPDLFDPTTLAAARARLQEAGAPRPE